MRWVIQHLTQALHYNVCYYSNLHALSCNIPHQPESHNYQQNNTHALEKILHRTAHWLMKGYNRHGVFAMLHSLNMPPLQHQHKINRFNRYKQLISSSCLVYHTSYQHNNTPVTTTHTIILLLTKYVVHINTLFAQELLKNGIYP